MRRVSGNVEIYPMIVYKLTVEGRTTLENAATDGICTNQNHHLWIGCCVVADLKWFGHIGRNWAGNHNSIGMSGGGNKFDTESAYVELNIVGSVEFPFATVITSG